MMTRTFTKIAYVSLALFIFSNNVLAAEAPKQEEKISINIPPELSKGEKEYSETLTNLTPAQQETLLLLDETTIKANEPQFTLSAKTNEFIACEKLDPTIEKTHGKMLQTFRYVKLDEMRAGMNDFMTVRDKIDFIDRKLLGDHLNYSRTMHMQLVNGMAGIAAKMIVENKDTKKCDELKKELQDGYSKPYVVATSNAPSSFNKIPYPDGSAIGCSLGFTHDDQQEKKHYSIAVLFITDKNGESFFEISGKIGKDGKEWLPLGEVWVDFGSINTRFAAKHERPHPRMIIASMPAQMAVPALWYMRQNKVVSAIAEQTGPESQVAFESDVVPMTELEKMASCISKNAPNLTEPLKKAGFTLAN